MAVNYSPAIVKDGLVLHLDAANYKSYPGSGTVWSDRSGFGNNGTLTNGPTFNSANGGSIVFDGSNDYINVNSSNLKPTNGITQEFWIKAAARATVFMGLQYGSSTNNSYALWWGEYGTNTWQGGVNIGGTFYILSATSTWPNNVWCHYVHTYDGSTQKLYFNGNLLNSENRTGLIAYDVLNTTTTVGCDFNGSGYNNGIVSPILGSIGSTRIYNRGLSEFEIKQNFNATRRRFGL